MKIIAPQRGEPAYAHAANAFQSLYEQVTGIHLPIVTEDDGGDIVVIGSDAVNAVLADPMINGTIESLGVCYGTDDYCIRCMEIDGRRMLILAGGRGRSTLYAVYDYFEREAGCHWFWDGDVIPSLSELPLRDLQILESPHFHLRGLRYFAHRSLHRFQAEHWGFADWKRELDYLTKRRLNFFMLRIGMDDLWQRAFPDACDYTVEAPGDGYNDRTPFWSLQYRGELRTRVLAYARELDLIHPEDCGTMSHWYSPAPDKFLENVKPDFFPQADNQYTNPRTLVWDIRKERNLDNYMKLTETAVRDFNPDPEYFHTIGLGERNMMPDKASNLRLKKYTYRRIAQSIREKYPNSKLLIASWDLAGWWKGEEIAEQLKEFDPNRTIVLEYTGEIDDEKQAFFNWGMVGKFPWIFGLFHAYQPDNSLRGPYERSDERLRVAVNDPKCMGMVLWPELSHSDPLILEYLTENAWNPLTMTIEQLTERFCARRYGARAEQMNTLWQAALPIIKIGDWGGFSQREASDPEAKKYTSRHSVFREMWTDMLETFLLPYVDPHRNSNFTYRAKLPVALPDHFLYKIETHSEALAQVPELLQAAIPLCEIEDRFIQRDLLDICRTALGRFMNFVLMKIIVCADSDHATAAALREPFMSLLDVMGELLAYHSDYSLYQTMQQIATEQPITEGFETTLKHNCLAIYCRSYITEPCRFLYPKEAAIALEWLCTPKEERPELDFRARKKQLAQEFIDTPLECMQTPPTRSLPMLLKLSAEQIALIGKL